MKLIFTITTVLLLIVSCKHEAVEPEQSLAEGNGSNACDSNKVYFENDILPIFVASCAFSGCHDAGTAISGVVLTNYEETINSNVIVAGEPNNSEIFKRIIELDINERMPLGGNRLPQEEIDKIELWILDGALNSSCDD